MLNTNEDSELMNHLWCTLSTAYQVYHVAMKTLAVEWEHIFWFLEMQWAEWYLDFFSCFNNSWPVSYKGNYFYCRGFSCLNLPKISKALLNWNYKHRDAIFNTILMSKLRETSSQRMSRLATRFCCKKQKPRGWWQHTLRWFVFMYMREVTHIFTCGSFRWKNLPNK